MMYFIVNSFEVLYIGSWGHVVGVLAIGGLDQSFLPWSGKLQVNQCYKVCVQLRGDTTEVGDSKVVDRIKYMCSGCVCHLKRFRG